MSAGGDDFVVVEAMGITVVPVAQLRPKVCVVAGQDIALIRPDLDDEDRAAAVDWLIQHVAAR